MKNQPESHNNNSIGDEKLTPGEEWAQRVHARAIDCSSTPKEELSVQEEVRLDKERMAAEARGERWFHPHALLYGQGVMADAYRKKAAEYFEAQGARPPEGEKVFRFLQWRKRYTDELGREPSAETTKNAWNLGLK